MTINLFAVRLDTSMLSANHMHLDIIIFFFFAFYFGQHKMVLVCHSCKQNIKVLNHHAAAANSKLMHMV